jgi:3-dehydroquinate synthetase
VDELIQHMRFDKKRKEGNIRLVLLKRIGTAAILEQAQDDLIRKGWAYALETGR